MKKKENLKVMVNGRMCSRPKQTKPKKTNLLAKSTKATSLSRIQKPPIPKPIKTFDMSFPQGVDTSKGNIVRNIEFDQKGRPQIRHVDLRASYQSISQKSASQRSIRGSQRTSALGKKASAPPGPPTYKIQTVKDNNCDCLGQSIMRLKKESLASTVAYESNFYPVVGQN